MVYLINQLCSAFYAISAKVTYILDLQVVQSAVHFLGTTCVVKLTFYIYKNCI